MIKDIDIKGIEYYTSEKESQILERKSAKIKPIDILRHLVGFANSDGGQLAIGIDDDGTISGFNSQAPDRIDQFRTISFTYLKETPIITKNNIINVKNKYGEDDIVLIITVDFSSNRVIKSYDGKVYFRQNDQTVELNAEQIIQLQYDKCQRYFEDEIFEQSSFEDIDLELLEEYKTIMGVADDNILDLLNARNLMINGKLTTAGVLLFSKHPTKFMPQARLKVVKYDGMHLKVGKDINIIKERTFDGPIPRIIKEAKIFIGSQLREFQYLSEDGRFLVMPEYPEFAWFEGIVNALTHRNYSITGDYIRVSIFDDRMEILSPGKLPNVVTIENIRFKRFSRNPRIARILSEFGWVKELNEGVKRIYSEMEKSYLHDPVYSEPDDNVLLVLENNILNRYLRVSDKLRKLIDENIFNSLTESEFLIIHYMFNMGVNMNTRTAAQVINKGSTFCRKTLKTLERKGLLEWHGSSPTDSTQYYTLDF